MSSVNKKKTARKTSRIIDNFAEVRKHLRFDNPGDIYVAHVMFRVKDLRSEGGKDCYLSHDDTTRLIKTYYVDSLEYYDKKKPAMIDLAENNHARVYIAMTRKNRLTCNRVILKKLVDEVDNPNVRYDHLIRSSVCGCHISEYKWWTLDVDNNTMVQDPEHSPGCEVYLMDIRDKVIADMAKLVDETKTRSGSEIFTVPTKNGCHIMTPPFNRSKMAFLGDNLKSDAMTLLYFNCGA